MGKERGEGQKQACKAKNKNTNKGIAKHHCKKGRMDFTKWNVRDESRDTHHSTVHKVQVGNTLTTGKTQTSLQTIGEQICWMTRLGNKRHDKRCCRNLHKHSLNLCMMRSIPVREGLSICGLSVGDEMQQHAHERAGWNEDELTDGRKVELLDGLQNEPEFEQQLVQQL